MDKIYTLATHAFDPIHQFWESKRTQSFVAGVLVVVFLAALLGVELNRRDLAPEWLSWFTADSHFYAVNLAFSLVLLIEVVHLVFTVPCSISRSVGTQFEILALILLRGAFKKLSAFPEPITVVGHMAPVQEILAASFGALAIFAMLGLYRHFCRPEEDIRSDRLFRFVAAKKIVALALLGIFIWMGALDAWLAFRGLPGVEFFPDFYTVLIFSDILLVLIAGRFQPKFRSVFRNSGFVLSTLIIRLALSAPPYYREVLGLASITYALLLTMTYNRFYAPKK